MSYKGRKKLEKKHSRLLSSSSRPCRSDNIETSVDPMISAFLRKLTKMNSLTLNDSDTID